MTVKFNPFVLLSLVIGVIFILFLLVRGCKYSENKYAENIVLKESLDSMVLKNERDSMVAAQHEKDYADSLQFVNGELSLEIVKRVATEEKLLATTNNAAFWKQKYQSVQPDMDTSVTLTPNEFIQDCHECFDDLEQKDRLIKSYVQQVKSVDSTHKVKEKIQENRIKELASERNTFQQNAEDAILIAAKAQKLSERRRKGFISLGLMGEKEHFIMGIGAGGFYMDKRERVFGGNLYGTNRGPYVTANIMMPLSFRRKP